MYEKSVLLFSKGRERITADLLETHVVAPYPTILFGVASLLLRDDVGLCVNRRANRNPPLDISWARASLRRMCQRLGIGGSRGRSEPCGRAWISSSPPWIDGERRFITTARMWLSFVPGTFLSFFPPIEWMIPSILLVFSPIIRPVAADAPGRGSVETPGFCRASAVICPDENRPTPSKLTVGIPAIVSVKEQPSDLFNESPLN